MNQCNDPDHYAINAERSETRGLRKAWVELDDKRQILEKQLAAVTEQRDEALSDLEFRRDLFVLQEQQLNDVRAERDRLAEALREITTYDPSDGQCNSGYSCKYIAEQALQSLTTNDKDLARRALDSK